jgi:hypothetical protein
MSVAKHQNSNAPTATRPCPVCGEDIKRVALYCVHCGSYLDWRRVFNFSPIQVSLLIALISVIGAYLPKIADLFTANNSQFIISFQDADASTLSFLVSNIGVRPGSFLGVGSLAIAGNESGKIRYYRIKSTGENRTNVIPSGTSELFSYWLPNGRPERPNERISCSATFMGTDFTGTRRFVTAPFSCTELDTMWKQSRTPLRTN